METFLITTLRTNWQNMLEAKTGKAAQLMKIVICHMFLVLFTLIVLDLKNDALSDLTYLEL